MSPAASPSSDSPEVPSPDTSGVADRLRKFVIEHGGSGTAVVEYLGRGGARIVVVSVEGPFTDAVVGGGMEVATLVCQAAGIPIAGWDRELSGRISISTADRVRMAGTGR